MERLVARMHQRSSERLGDGSELLSSPPVERVRPGGSFGGELRPHRTADVADHDDGSNRAVVFVGVNSEAAAGDQIRGQQCGDDVLVRHRFVLPLRRHRQAR